MRIVLVLLLAFALAAPASVATAPTLPAPKAPIDLGALLAPLVAPEQVLDVADVPRTLADTLEKPLRALPELSVASATAAADVADGCAGAEDAGDNRANATPLALPADCQGTLDWEDWLDIYVVDVPAGEELVARVTPNVLSDFDICILSPAWEALACSMNWDNAVDETSVVTNVTGGWYVALIQWDGEGDYRFEASHGPAPPLPADCVGDDFADDAIDAAPLAWPVDCGGHLRVADDRLDWFTLDAHAGRALFIEVNSSAAVACAFLPTDLARPLACGFSLDGWGAAPLYLDDPRAPSLVVAVEGLGTTSYVLHIEEADAQDDCGTGFDGPQSLYYPAAIALDVPCVGAVEGAMDLFDIFTVERPEGYSIAAEGTLSGAPGYVCTVSPPDERGYIREGWCRHYEAGEPVFVRGPTGPAGPYLVAVVSNGVTAYDLVVRALPPTPQDDCRSGADAGGSVESALATALPLACEGDLLADEGDLFDFYRFSAAPGPIHARLMPDADLDLCLVAVDESHGTCSFNWDAAAEDVSLLSPGGEYYLVVIYYEARGHYALWASQQDDCGTGGDAGDVPASLDAPFLTCDGELDPWIGDAADGYLLAGAPRAGVTVVRLTSLDAGMAVCVVDDDTGVRSFCTTAGSSRPLVHVRLADEPLHLVVEGAAHATYTLSVENAFDVPSLT